MNNETYLVHHGVKGMRWGVRKEPERSSNKRHIGIDENGNINVIKGKTSKKAKQRFAVKAALSVGLVGAYVFMSKNPRLVSKGASYVRKSKVVSLDDLINQSGPTIVRKTPVDTVSIGRTQVDKILTSSEGFANTIRGMSQEDLKRMDLW